MASPTGKRNGASRAFWAQPEDFHDMGNIGVSKPFRRLFQFFAHAKIDPFGGSTLSASQMVVVTMTVAQTIYLRAVLSDTSFDDLGPFELFETTVGGHEITRIRRQRRKSFLRRTGSRHPPRLPKSLCVAWSGANPFPEAWKLPC